MNPESIEIWYGPVSGALLVFNDKRERLPYEAFTMQDFLRAREAGQLRLVASRGTGYPYLHGAVELYVRKLPTKENQP